MAKISAEKFEDYFRYFCSEPQQKNGIRELYNSMPTSLLEDDSKWMELYKERSEPPAETGVRILDVPFDCQHTNPSGQGWRECFSSSCAMVAKYWLPDLEINEYLNKRPHFGDSTDASAQIATLNYFGLEARFVSWGSADKLKAQIDRGRPAPVGWLHNGHVSCPAGGGHYSVVIGYDDNTLNWIQNDPNGEANLVMGGYSAVGAHGKGIQYSYLNWNKRWLIEGPHSGWGLDIYLP